jgi:uncharacterized protein
MLKIGLILKKNWKRLTLLIFVLMNVVAFFHAYKFTHFADAQILKTGDTAKLTFGQKLSALAFGVNNPRPKNDSIPKVPFTNLTISKGKEQLVYFRSQFTRNGLGFSWFFGKSVENGRKSSLF